MRTLNRGLAVAALIIALPTAAEAKKSFADAADAPVWKLKDRAQAAAKQKDFDTAIRLCQEGAKKYGKELFLHCVSRNECHRARLKHRFASSENEASQGLIVALREGDASRLESLLSCGVWKGDPDEEGPETYEDRYDLGKLANDLIRLRTKEFKAGGSNPVETSGYEDRRSRAFELADDQDEFQSGWRVRSIQERKPAR